MKRKYIGDRQVATQYGLIPCVVVDLVRFIDAKLFRPLPVSIKTSLSFTMAGTLNNNLS